MIDFTSALEEFNVYKGSEKKKTLVYNGARYLVKFPDPIRERNKNISYINNAYSEYVGSNIFKIVGFKVQETILGKYIYNAKEKIVCACRDFTDATHQLYEFESLALSMNPDKKIGTELSDIMEVIDAASNLIDVFAVKEKFWDMFIVDALIGNTDRHNGNWGFIKTENEVYFAPIYDCGSALNPLLTDEDIQALDASEVKNLAVNVYSCLKEDGQKINFLNYIKSMDNLECNEALMRIVPKIDIDKIITFIDNIEGMSNIRKDFYKRCITIRYEIIKDTYDMMV